MGKARLEAAEILQTREMGGWRDRSVERSRDDRRRCILRKNQRDGLVMKLRLEKTQEGARFLA